jgi:hypothetical protein
MRLLPKYRPEAAHQEVGELKQLAIIIRLAVLGLSVVSGTIVQTQVVSHAHALTQLSEPADDPVAIEMASMVQVTIEMKRPDTYRSANSGEEVQSTLQAHSERRFNLGGVAERRTQRRMAVADTEQDEPGTDGLCDLVELRVGSIEAGVDGKRLALEILNERGAP